MRVSSRVVSSMSFVVAAASLLAACGGSKGGGGGGSPGALSAVSPVTSSVSAAPGATPSPTLSPGSPTAPALNPGSPSAPTGQPSSAGQPSSQAFMTEAEEVALINSVGFDVTVADLRASYEKFKPQAVSQDTNVLWDTESDDLRNYFRLFKRTGYQPFRDQAKAWRDFMVDTYSQWKSGGSNRIEAEHMYLMGLIDWYLDNKDQATLDAIERIVDFIHERVNANKFIETRMTARALECLVYYREKIGRRDVLPKIREFLASLDTAKVQNGLVLFRVNGSGAFEVTGLPAGEDLRTRFPRNDAAGLIASRSSYKVGGQEAAWLFQDTNLMHAWFMAGRTVDPRYTERAASLARAWVPLIRPPFFDTTGEYAPASPRGVIGTAPELEMYSYPTNGSPMHDAVYSAFCPDPALKRTLVQKALLRHYSELKSVQPGELGGKPKYYPWQTHECGYFLTQK